MEKTEKKLFKKEIEVHNKFLKKYNEKLIEPKLIQKFNKEKIKNLTPVSPTQIELVNSDIKTDTSKYRFSYYYKNGYIELSIFLLL